MGDPGLRPIHPTPKPKLLESHNTGSYRRNRGVATAIVQSRILRISFCLILAKDRKVASCVWLFTWGCYRTGTQSGPTHLDPSLTWSSRLSSREGLLQGQHVIFVLRSPRLVSFFPLCSLCVWASKLPRAKMKHRFMLHVWRWIKDCSSWLSHTMGPLKPCRRTGHGL